MTDRDDEPRQVVPPKFRRQLRIADAGIAVCITVAGVALIWMVMHPAQVVPPPLLEVPPEPYWVPGPPIRDSWAFGTAMAAAFISVLACHLDPAYPLVNRAARKFGRPDLAAPHGRLWGIFAPALRQSSLRLAALVAGVVGISLWHLGASGMELLREAVPGLWVLGLAAVGIVLAFDPRRPDRPVRRPGPARVSDRGRRRRMGTRRHARGVVTAPPRTSMRPCGLLPDPRTRVDRGRAGRRPAASPGRPPSSGGPGFVRHRHVRL